jgi:hypothetical protein
MLKEAYMIEYIKDPKWSNEQKTAIDCLVKFNHCKNEVPFTADPNDVEAHGRCIFRRCTSGDFSDIGDYDGVSLHQNFQPPRFQQTLSPRFIQQFLGMLSEANAENNAGTARGIVLVWGAFLEVVLKDYIESHYRAQDVTSIPAKIRKKMITLGGKISVADGLCLLSQDIKKDLEAVKEIRNMAAHNLHFSEFSHIVSEKAQKAYKHLYEKFASCEYHEVEDLLFVVKFVYGTGCQMAVFELSGLHDDLLGTPA